MNRPNKAVEMVTILEDFLRSNAGVKQVTVDGQTVMFDRAQAMAELAFWRAEAARAAGRRSVFRCIDVGSAW